MIKYMKWVASVLLVATSFTTPLWTQMSIANTSTQTNVTINHVSGTTSVPTSPKKVVVFDIAALDNMSRLGIKAVVGIPEGKNHSICNNLMMQNMKKLVPFLNLIMKKLPLFNLI